MEDGVNGLRPTRMLLVVMLGWVLIGVTVSLAAAQVAGKSLARDERDVSTLVWQSRYGAEGLPLELTHLYVTLWRAGLLGEQGFTERHVQASGERVETILRKKGQFYGAHFPKPRDDLMCALNAHVCEQVAVGDNRWSSEPGDTLRIPKLALAEVPGVISYSKKRSESLAKIVTANGGCKTLDQECAERLERLNRFQSVDEAASFDGVIYVPARTIRAEVAADALSPYQRDVLTSQASFAVPGVASHVATAKVAAGQQ